MYIVTGKEMAEIDRRAIEELGIPQVVLMENAGLKVFEEIRNKLGDVAAKKITIIAGKGNNGGDGLVVARHLCNHGADVKVFLVGSKEFTGASLVNFQIAQKLPITFYTVENENSLHLLKLTLHYTEVLIDALLGTGMQGEVKGIALRVIETANIYNCLKIAVDIPSGIDADTGDVFTVALKADITVTFGYPKVGLVKEPGLSYVGEVKVVDISIPSQIVDEIKLERVLLTKELIKDSLPLRQAESHKGTYGHLLIIGGSVGMQGAPYLSALGGFALGAGLVTMAVPKSVQASLASAIPEAMVFPVTESQEGTLGLVSGPEILKLAKGKTAIVLGPGLGFNNETAPLIKWLLHQKELEKIPIIIDADGLKALAQDMECLKEVKNPLVLTPHPGEMARILKISTQEVQANRWEVAASLAKQWGSWVVLKGRVTVIATPEGQLMINPTGSPALATAGTGDILAGMIGAMAGQGDLKAAITTSVFIHGLAGQWVSLEVGEISSKASDIIGAIPKVIKKEFRT